MSTVKRAKTTTTYSTKKPTASSLEREQFNNVFGQDATAPNTSPSIRFSDHSGAKNSSALPTGSLQADFAHHEPAMFKESGSTIPDNESSHERMVEQALRSKSAKAASSPEKKLTELDEMPKSSSFPWSASEQTEVARSHVARDEHVTAPGSGAENDANRPLEPNGSEQHVNLMPNNDTIPGPATAVMVAPSIHNEAHRASPTVHINPVEISIAPVAQPDAVSGDKAQKSSKGRKCKAQEESSEPLNSDNIAVGLPKERYVPRPSRRRATSTVEEAIDYSVVPEKAAKSKRSKTMGSSANPVYTQLEPTSKELSPKTSKKTKPVRELEAAEATRTAASRSSANETLSQSVTQVPKPSPVVEVPATIETSPAESKETMPHSAINTSTENSKVIDSKDGLAFAKPAPKKKPAPKSKPKRSSTTIFEDHVEFTGKSKSPSLSQQQAMRQSAFIDVKNEATPLKRKRSGKAVILDDEDENEEEDLPVRNKRIRKAVLPDDDEDELAFDPQSQDDQADEPPDEPPKKRGRGRPSKSVSKGDAEATAKSAKQEDHAKADGTVQPAPEKPTKKRRGRPPKSAASVPMEDESKDADDTSNDQPARQEDKQSAEKSIETSAAESTQAKSNSATEIPTPSPEKQPSVEAKTAPDKKTKASPTAHSPIKSSSPAPYRVGLSKKHRIPSLLRVMRPPPTKLPSKK
jgi:hypothetical protein